MNLLDYYIKEIYDENLYYYNGEPYYKVKILVSCWGGDELKEKCFEKDSWEYYKKQGYYTE